MMPSDMMNPPTARVVAMQGIRNILEYESLQPGQLTPEQLAANGITSQYDLLKLLFSIDKDFARSIMDSQICRHPTALDIQNTLLNFQPGLLNLLISVTTDPTHPLYHEDNFKRVRDLIDNQFPTTSSSLEDVQQWGSDLKDALVGFIHISIICANFSADDASRAIGNSTLFPGINPILFSSFFIDRARRMKPHPAPYRIGKGITNLNGILVHGNVPPNLEGVITEIATAHKYFLGRKLTILKNLEPNDMFTVGIYNVMTIVKDSPFMCIGYRIDNEDSHNVPEIGIDYKDLVPVVCLNPNCYQLRNCVVSVHQDRFIYVNTKSVKLGEPPLAARKTVDFDKMQEAWVNHAINNNLEAPQLCDQLQVEEERRLRFRAVRGTDLGYRVLWDEEYLYFLRREYREKMAQDNLLLKLHLTPAPTTDRTEVNLRLDDIFVITAVLFMPIIYKRMN
ncbi:unnamed protein product [Caenorhabditis brenneri]